MSEAITTHDKAMEDLLVLLQPWIGAELVHRLGIVVNPPTEGNDPQLLVAVSTYVKDAQPVADQFVSRYYILGASVAGDTLASYLGLSEKRIELVMDVRSFVKVYLGIAKTRDSDLGRDEFKLLVEWAQIEFPQLCLLDKTTDGTE